MSDLSNRSRSLFCSERGERFAHGCSFLKKVHERTAHSFYRKREERKSEFPTLFMVNFQYNKTGFIKGSYSPKKSPLVIRLLYLKFIICEFCHTGYMGLSTSKRRSNYILYKISTYCRFTYYERVLIHSSHLNSPRPKKRRYVVKVSIRLFKCFTVIVMEKFCFSTKAFIFLKFYSSWL